jgi:hypothetical protein
LGAEQIYQIVPLASQRDAHRPISQWSHRVLADEIACRRITERMSPRRAAPLLEGADFQPLRARYWLTPAAHADRDSKIADMCAVYQGAAEGGRRMQCSIPVIVYHPLARLSESANSAPVISTTATTGRQKFTGRSPGSNSATRVPRTVRRLMATPTFGGSAGSSYA